MALNTGIDWTDHTWNPWQGCRKVSPGCLNCYMYRDKKRFNQEPATVIRSKAPTFNSPLNWKDPAKVFVCSWSDFFIENADPWRDEAWDIIRRTPHLTYQLLTKRPENIPGRLPKDWPLTNVWIGVTAENQEQADKRIPMLLEVPFVGVRFISVEPMIEEITLKAEFLRIMSQGQWMNNVECGHGVINLVICGGETGPEAREMNPMWALSLKRQCENTNTPFFMKQMTNKAPIPDFLEGREFPKA